MNPSLSPSVRLPDIKSPAEYAFQSLASQIQQFEAATSNDEVVGAMLASFGQSVTIHIHQIRLAGQFFCMEGLAADGSAATLIQHFTQTSLLLLKMPKAPVEEKRPIGFIW
jgi:hypothetical protein